VGLRLPAPEAKLARELCADFYRGILGREPDEDGLRADVEALRRTDGVPVILRDMNRSEEARNLLAAARTVSLGGGIHRFDLPPEDIESRCAPEELARAWSRVRAVWERLGVLSPHHSVVSEERFEPSQFSGHEDAFWESGVSEAATLLGLLRRHGISESDWSRMDCVEFGCGVGRVTFALAPHVRRVEAWDISAPHLRLAQERMALVGAANIAFRHCTLPPKGTLLPCDLFYSRIVFQHNPPPVIRELIAAALQSLKPGGTAIFQLPVHSPRYRFRTSEWLERQDSLDMEMHCLPQAQVFELIAECGCSLLEVREENSPKAPAQFISKMFVVRRPA